MEIQAKHVPRQEASASLSSTSHISGAALYNELEKRISLHAAEDFQKVWSERKANTLLDDEQKLRLAGLWREVRPSRTLVVLRVLDHIGQITEEETGRLGLLTQLSRYSAESAEYAFRRGWEAFKKEWPDMIESLSLGELTAWLSRIEEAIDDPVAKDIAATMRRDMGLTAKEVSKNPFDAPFSVKGAGFHVKLLDWCYPGPGNLPISSVFVKALQSQPGQSWAQKLNCLIRLYIREQNQAELKPLLAFFPCTPQSLEMDTRTQLRDYGVRLIQQGGYFLHKNDVADIDRWLDEKPTPEADAFFGDRITPSQKLWNWMSRNPEAAATLPLEMVDRIFKFADESRMQSAAFKLWLGLEKPGFLKQELEVHAASFHVDALTEWLHATRNNEVLCGELQACDAMLTRLAVNILTGAVQKGDPVAIEAAEKVMHAFIGNCLARMVFAVEQGKGRDLHTLLCHTFTPLENFLPDQLLRQLLEFEGSTQLHRELSARAERALHRRSVVPFHHSTGSISHKYRTPLVFDLYTFIGTAPVSEISPNPVPPNETEDAATLQSGKHTPPEYLTQQPRKESTEISSGHPPDAASRPDAEPVNRETVSQPAVESMSDRNFGFLKNHLLDAADAGNPAEVTRLLEVNKQGIGADHSAALENLASDWEDIFGANASSDAVREFAKGLAVQTDTAPQQQSNVADEHSGTADDSLKSGSPRETIANESTGKKLVLFEDVPHEKPALTEPMVEVEENASVLSDGRFFELKNAVVGAAYGSGLPAAEPSLNELKKSDLTPDQVDALKGVKAALEITGRVQSDARKHILAEITKILKERNTPANAAEK